jgi:hypothetical protein
VPRPRRLASRTALRTTRLIPGAPSAPLSHSAPFRSPDRHRLLAGPAHNVSRPNQRQRVETPSLGSAPAMAGAHRAPTTRRATTSSATALKARSGPPHAPVGSDARGGTTPLGTGVRFVRKAHSQPNTTARPHCVSPPFAPAPAAPEPRAGDGGRHCDGVPASRPRRVQPSTSRVMGFLCHIGCMGSAYKGTLWPMGAFSPRCPSFPSGRHQPPPSLRHVVIMSHYTLHPRGSLRAVSVSARPSRSLRLRRPWRIILAALRANK